MAVDHSRSAASEQHPGTEELVAVAAVYDRRQSLLSTSRAVIDRPFNFQQQKYQISLTV
jgi:hypothetical protein